MTGSGQRLREAAVALGLVALAFHQAPGLTVADTKLDLTQNPAEFLARALRLWEPTVAMGQLQNQAYGYLFPMGPFYLVADAVGASDYVAGRAWWALLLVTAYVGVLALARALDLGTGTTRIVAASAYALAPRMLTVMGPISSEALPVALLPWVLLPLVLCTRGRLAPRRAGLLSGLAVLCTGGVNATATVAVLVLPGLWVLFCSTREIRLRLCAWWTAGVVLATAWWLGPLLLMGRYSFPFLDYVESSSVTTLRTSAGEVLRGSSHWVGYVSVGGRPWWGAGAELATSPQLVVLTSAVAAAGVAGLVLLGRGRERSVLAASVLLGVVAMWSAWTGPLSGPLAPVIQEALDGALSPFRNVHKFDPLVRLPLALGMAHVLAVAVRSIRADRTVGRGQGLRLQPRAQRRGVIALACLLVLATASPALAGRLAPDGAFVEVPEYWREAAQHVDATSGGSTTLVVPAEGFARFAWGRTVDEPIQTLLRGPWVARQQAGPISGTGVVRWLDAVESEIAAGRPSPGLADALAAQGIGQVLVRHDLDWAGTGAPRPSVVHSVFSNSPGFALDATFGPRSPGPRDDDLFVDDGLRTALPAIEVYRVVAASPRVRVLPQERATTLYGDADAAIDLADAGADLDRPLLLPGDLPRGESSLGPDDAVVTDSVRKRVMAFGAVRDNTSHTLPASDEAIGGGRVADLRSDPAQQATVSQVLGVASVRASSSASDAGAAIDRSLAAHPYSAIDGDGGTAWLSGTVSRAGGQWWEVEFEQPRSVEGLTVVLARSKVARAPLTQVVVTTDAGSASTDITMAATEFTPTVPPGLTRTLRLSVGRFGTTSVQRGALGLAEVELPGLSVERTMQVPTAGQETSEVLLTASRGGGPGCVDVGPRVVCSPVLANQDEERGRFDRTVTLPSGTSSQDVAVRAALDVDAAERLLAGDVRVSVSSQRVDHPASSALALVDGDPGTTWVADAADAAPSVRLEWDAARSVGVVRVLVDEDAAASVPQRLRVRSEGGEDVVRLVEIRSDQLSADDEADGVLTLEATFPARPTTWLELSFPDVAPRASQQVALGNVIRLPVGLAGVEVPSLADVMGGPSPVTPVVVGCGDIPGLLVDGVPQLLRGRTTWGDVVRGETVELSVCDGARSGVWGGGERRVVADEGLSVDSVHVDTSPEVAPTSRGDRRRVDVASWDAQRRTVDVSAGSAAVLVVAENANPGWTATTPDGVELAPVRVEGWKQGWLLPEGDDVTVVLEFEPGRTFTVLLGAGAAAVLLLLVLLAVREPAAATPTHRSLAQAHRSGPSWRRRVGIGAGVLVALLLGGPAAVAGLAITALIVRRQPSAMPVAAAGLTLIAGAVTAVHLVLPFPWPALPESLSSVAAVTALVLLAVAVWTPPTGRGPRHSKGSVVVSGDAIAAGPAAPRVGAAAQPVPVSQRAW